MANWAGSGWLSSSPSASAFGVGRGVDADAELRNGAGVRAGKKVTRGGVTVACSRVTHHFAHRTHPLNGVMVPLNEVKHDVACHTHRLNDRTHPLNGVSVPLNGRTHPLNEVMVPLNGVTHPLNDRTIDLGS